MYPPESNFARCLHAVKREICDILTNPQYYCTQEVYQELRAIDSRVEHLRLDNDIYSRSEKCQKEYDPSAMATEKKDVTGVLDRAASFLSDLKQKLNKCNLLGKQEPEIREHHEWAMLNLTAIERDLDPYLSNAHHRIQRFSEHSGATDRFTGYRHNLTRGAINPFVYDSNWLKAAKKRNDVRYHTGLCGTNTMRLGNRLFSAPLVRYPLELPPEEPTGVLGTKHRLGWYRPPRLETIGYQTIDSLYPRGTATYYYEQKSDSKLLDDAKALNALNATDGYEGNGPHNFFTDFKKKKKKLSKAEELRAIQEAAGLNIDFPGQSEYMLHFKKPPTDFPGPDFLINPAPNLSAKGMGPPEKVTYVPNSTEYQSHYDWPDSQNIIKLPWLRDKIC